ncbi:MAG: SoxR reducing system RseC family protein [Agarilytica sp.]
MLKESGLVVAIEEDGLWLETVQQSACASCAAKTGCGTQVLAKLTANKNMTFVKAFFDEQSRNLPWRIGDRAILGVQENALVFAALIAYGVPLICMLIASSIATLYFQHDFYVALGAAFGIVCGAVLVKAYMRKSRGSTRFHARVIGLAVASEILS